MPQCSSQAKDFGLLRAAWKGRPQEVLRGKQFSRSLTRHRSKAPRFSGSKRSFAGFLTERKPRLVRWGHALPRRVAVAPTTTGVRKSPRRGTSIVPYAQRWATHAPFFTKTRSGRIDGSGEMGPSLGLSALVLLGHFGGSFGLDVVNPKPASAEQRGGGASLLRQ